MKGFISYRFTGESEKDLKDLLIPIQNKLKEIGVDAYCNILEKGFEIRSKNFKPQDYVFDAFKTLNNVELLFVLITSEGKSEGMLMEVGYSLAKLIPIIVAVKSDVKGTYLPGMAKLVINFDDTDDLLKKITKIDIKNL
jgi:hypothetical protein